MFQTLQTVQLLWGVEGIWVSIVKKFLLAQLSPLFLLKCLYSFSLRVYLALQSVPISLQLVGLCQQVVLEPFSLCPHGVHQSLSFMPLV